MGDNIRYTPGVARRVFNALDGINIRMISQGASLLNLSFVVAEADLRARSKRCTASSSRELDPAVFERNGGRACLSRAAWPSSATARWAG